jgi:hypothetical protein
MSADDERAAAGEVRCLKSFACFASGLRLDPSSIPAVLLLGGGGISLMWVSHALGGRNCGGSCPLWLAVAGGRGVAR